MNRKITKSLCLSMAMILLITFIPLMKPIQANAADYSAWSTIFNPTYYASHYQDAKKYANGDVDLLWQHFLKVGIPNGRQACMQFNVNIYMQNYPELQQMYGGDLTQYYIHYATVGYYEGRNAMYLNSTAGKMGATVPDSFKSGYSWADYPTFNAHTSENGCDNWPVWIEGTITGFIKYDFVGSNGAVYYGYLATITGSDGNKWSAIVYDTESNISNPNEIVTLVNKKVCLTGVYVGYADRFSMPAIRCSNIYDEASGKITAAYSKWDPYYSAKAPTTTTTTTSTTKKTTTSSSTGYESIYNTYAAKINSYSGSDINYIASLWNEGTSKMADYYYSHGGSYSTYESWATKLYDVYEKKGMSMYGF